MVALYVGNVRVMVGLNVENVTGMAKFHVRYVILAEILIVLDVMVMARLTVKSVLGLDKKIL
jgi:hypothetical protein